MTETQTLNLVNYYIDCVRPNVPVRGDLLCVFQCETSCILCFPWLLFYLLFLSFIGKALLERDSLDEAIKHLQRANDLAKEQKLNFGDDIAIQLRIARKKRWNIQEEKRIQQEIELQTYLNRLILEDRDRKIDDLRKTGEDVDLQVGFFSSFEVRSIKSL